MNKKTLSAGAAWAVYGVGAVLVVSAAAIANGVVGGLVVSAMALSPVVVALACFAEDNAADKITAGDVMAFAKRYARSEITIAHGGKPSDADIDAEAEAWNRIKRVLGEKKKEMKS